MARLSTSQQVQHLFELDTHLSQDLVGLIEILLGALSAQLETGAADGETLVIEQVADLSHHDDVMALVIATVAAPLGRPQLWELLLPVAQDVWLDGAELADLTDREVAFAGDRREIAGSLVVRAIGRFQHRTLPAASASDLGGRSRRGGR